MHPCQYFTHLCVQLFDSCRHSILTISDFNSFRFFWDTLYTVQYSLGISQEIGIVLKTKDFRRLGAQLSKLLHTRVHKAKFMHLFNAQQQ
jgi:hypothetical protein